MKQAYEEVSEHRRLDYEAAKRLGFKREQQYQEEIALLNRELERQRELMAQYTEYLRKKSDEVITSIEDAHDNRMLEKIHSRFR